MINARLLAALTAAFFLTGCGWITDQILKQNRGAAMVLGAGKAAASKAPIGIEEERSYGGAIAIKVVKKYGGLVEDEALVRYVGLVGNSMAAFSDRPDVRYHFGILKSESVNAVSAPGGYVFITMGALKKMRSEAELAGVLGHEIGHITARHALEIIKNIKAKSALVGAAASSADNPDFFKSIVNAFLDDYLARGLPKETEFEADRIGTALLAKVGYDPNGLADFLAGMIKKEEGHSDPFYDTHPDTQERVTKIHSQVKASGATGKKHVERLMKHVKSASAEPSATPATTDSAATQPAEKPSNAAKSRMGGK